MSTTTRGPALGTVARRLHDPSRCLSCGAGFSLLRVNVEAVADGRLTTIDLCEHCFRSEDSAWRLRWTAVQTPKEQRAEQLKKRSAER